MVYVIHMVLNERSCKFTLHDTQGALHALMHASIWFEHNNIDVGSSMSVRPALPADRYATMDQVAREVV